MSTIALIPARAGSNGVPRKNIRVFAGVPLIAYSILSAQQSQQLDRIIVSTECDEIARVARDFGAEVPFMRPHILASDFTETIDVVLHALDHLPDADLILLLQPTSPLRSSADINGILQFRADRECESVVSVCLCSKHPSHFYELDALGQMTSLMPLPSQPSSLRQNFSSIYYPNGALYLCTRKWLLEKRAFVGDGTLGYLMPPERSVDIDTPLDWFIAESLMHNTNFQL